MQSSKDKLLEKIGAIMDQFALSAPQMCESLMASWTKGDVESVERQLHRMKGTAANCGYERIAELALIVEDKVRAGQKESVWQLLLQLKDYCEKASSGVMARSEAL